MLAQIQAKIKDVEAQVGQAFANHSYLSGALAAFKEALSIAQSIAPASPVVEVMETAETVIEAVESAVAPLIPASE